jgi:hypothetical protein
MKPRPLYPYVQKWVDHSGKPWLYFRRTGRPRIKLPGPLGSPEFVVAYTAALNEARRTGKVMRVRSRIQTQDGLPIAVPLIGVYLLLLRGEVVYIGESMNMPERVAAHRNHGRPFDQVFYIATAANQRVALERILIKAIDPPQNRAHRGAR